MNLFNLVVEPQYRDIVQSCVDSLLSSDSEMSFFGGDGVECPYGVQWNGGMVEITNLSTVQPWNYQTVLGRVNDGEVTYHHVTRSHRVPYTPASINHNDEGYAFYGEVGGVRFAFPFTMFVIDGKKRYFLYEREMPHSVVEEIFVDLPNVITARHQEEFGFSLPDWHNDKTISDISNFCQIDKGELEDLLVMARHDKAVKAELQSRTGYEIIFENNFSGKDILTFNKDRHTHVFLPTGNGVVFVDDRNALYCVPDDDSLPGVVTNWFFQAGTSQHRAEVMVRTIARNYMTIPIKKMTGVHTLAGRDFFIHDGMIASKNTVKDILGEVPERFTEEQVMALTLSL